MNSLAVSETAMMLISISQFSTPSTTLKISTVARSLSTPIWQSSASSSSSCVFFQSLQLFFLLSPILLRWALHSSSNLSFSCLRRMLADCCLCRPLQEPFDPTDSCCSQEVDCFTFGSLRFIPTRVTFSCNFTSPR